ncbi:hypothetical protein DY000_02015274 [Brassica cretica]|uniref:Multidrug and toxic compound extrusion protein n=1 Tax=Brassica cretica TaxID=69181 RepID=A0ABQ7D6R7_BRACR|nr:hypothetical protein DY000_02015274 [Brassica cretica]
MEKGFSLVPKEEEEENFRNEKSADQTSYLSTEMTKKVSSMAAPMVAVAVSQYLLQVISIVMAGHLDEISLSGVAIATSLTNVTGFSLLFGLAGALETLCGQAFGAEQFRKISSYTYGSMLCLVLFCLPISLLWVFMDKLLELFHQDPLISQLACRYSIWLIPALFGYSILQSLTRYFQSQGLVLPLFLSSLFSHSLLLASCLLWVFMRDSSLHRETKNLRAQEIFLCMKQFIALAIPSAMMTCLTMSSLHYVLVNAIGASASTHVSNELGAGNPKAARAAATSAVFLGVIDATIGLWIGILIGSTLQTIVLAVVTFFASWEQEAAKARDRVIEVKPQDNQKLQSILQEDVQVLLKDVSENCQI